MSCHSTTAPLCCTINIPSRALMCSTARTSNRPRRLNKLPSAKLSCVSPSSAKPQTFPNRRQFVWYIRTKLWGFTKTNRQKHSAIVDAAERAKKRRRELETRTPTPTPASTSMRQPPQALYLAAGAAMFATLLSRRGQAFVGPIGGGVVRSTGARFRRSQSSVAGSRGHVRGKR